MNITWTTNTNYIIGKTNDVNLTNQRIAAFDLDDTLIETKSGKDFAVDDNDWKLFDNSIKDKLIKLSHDDYKLVIISNQMGVSKGKVNIDTLKSKIQKVINLLQLDFTIFCALNDDNYRKPKMGFWKLIDGIKEDSFFCGDAGGLPKRVINKRSLNKDFSDTDLKFAVNVGIKFLHRDEFVFDVKYDNIKVNYNIDFTQISTQQNYVFKSNNKEMIINVGLPASGKSFFTQKYIIPCGYEYINQDTLGTQKKCLTDAEKILKIGKSIVIDNTNVTVEHRSNYIQLAKKYNYECRCLIFTTDKDVCIHNSNYRNYVTDGKVKVIPKMVYNMMNKKYVKPKISEGFSEINEINFALDLSDEGKESYKKYYS